MEVGQRANGLQNMPGTGLGRSSAARHLQNLIEGGIVSKRIYGEIPLYGINNNDSRAKALVEFFTKIRL